MRFAEFLNVYPRDLTPAQIHHGATSNDVQMAQLYSYGYGHIVHDYLNGQRDGFVERGAQLTAYEDAVDFRSLESKLLDDVAGLWNYRNEVNFYGLNYNMERMWEPIIHGRWLRPSGLHGAASFSANGLAFEALVTFMARQRFVEDHGIDTLDQPGNREFNQRVTGFMQEYDATVAILDWAKDQRNLTIVPAPAQFEHSASRANADLLAIDYARETVVGVQIKTVASDSVRHERYDPDRIIVIDSTDLGNVAVMTPKSKRRAQDEAPRPWPGIICLARASEMNVYNNPDIGPQFVGMMAQRKARAAMYLSGMRVNYRPFAKSIGGKITEKLAV